MAYQVLRIFIRNYKFNTLAKYINVAYFFAAYKTADGLKTNFYDYFTLGLRT